MHPSPLFLTFLRVFHLDEESQSRHWGGFSLSFSLSRESESESESHFNFVIIAVFLEFVSVLEKGLRPLVLAINVSKFLPASIAVKDN